MCVCVCVCVRERERERERERDWVDAVSTALSDCQCWYYTIFIYAFIIRYVGSTPILITFIH